jgi:hypothetical protein
MATTLSLTMSTNFASKTVVHSRLAMHVRTFAALAIAIAASGVTAKENYREKAINADTKAKFAEVVTNVRKELDGGRYEYVKPDERTTIETKLAEMSAFFAENDTVAGMKQDTKIKLFNAQEVVNSILTRRDRDRVICKNEAPLGSHIPVTSCHTYGQEEDARQGTRNQLSEWSRAPCAVSGCVAAPAPSKK